MKALSSFCSLCEPVWAYLRRSIRRQMMFGFGAAALMIMAVAGYTLHDQQRNALYREGIRHATTLANALAKSSSSWVLENDVAGLQENMSGLYGTADFKRAFVLAPNGEVLASSHPEEIGMFASDAISRNLLKAAPESQVLIDQQNLIDIAMPVMADNRLIGWVRVELTRESANADLRRLDQIWLGFVLLAVLLVSLVSLFLSRTLTRGLNQLMSVTGKVAQGDRKERVNVEREDEIGVLARDFNSMLDTLHEIDLRFRQLAENINEVFWITDLDKHKMLYVSPAYELIWGRTVQLLIDSPRTWLESVHPDDRQRVTVAAAKQAEGDYDEKYRIVRPDAGIRWVHDRAFPIRDGNDRVYRIAGITEDVTERKIAEAKIQRYTQLYAALSQCNKAIVHCSSEEELFLQICRAAVQFGGMKMAWVGIVDTETRTVRPAASFGDHTAYLQDIKIFVDADSPFGRGPSGTAIRENRLYWCQNFLDDPAAAPWRERAIHAGFAASASLPLKKRGVVIGVFTLYSGEVNAFDESVRELLVEMATDVSFALDNIAGEVQRVHAEEEILFKNTVLKTQQDTSLDAILVVDQNGKIISCNQQFIDLWRLAPQLVDTGLDEPVLHSVVGLVENPEAFVARIQYLYEHRDEKSREEISLKDGRVVDRYSAPVTGADGRHFGRVWYFRDITGSKRAAEALRASRDLLGSIIENVPTRIFWKDRDLRYLGCNTRFARDAGYSSPGELTGKTDFDMGWKDQAELYRADDKEVLDSGAAKLDIEEPLTTPDGNMIWLHTSKVPLCDKDNQIIGILGLYQDITERKQAEQALRISEVRFKTMFMQAPFGIALIDSLSGHIYEVNSRFAEIAGRTMDQMANIDWLQITHPDDVQADLENMALLNAGKINGFQMEKRYLHPDGTAVWIDMTVTPLKVEDKTHPRHLCMIQDITERRESEARIKYLSRVHAVLSGINALIVRVQDRDELFREACRIAVENGGFGMALVAIVDPAIKKVVSIVSAGKDEELLAMIKDRLITSNDVSNTMVGLAIGGKQPVVSNDSLNDPRVVFGKIYADSGIRSMVILPLLVADEVVGTISLYAGESEFFHEEEMKLLTELAGDIAFAIDHIGKQEKLNYLAYYDVLTGLANRSLFLDRVSQYMRSAVSGGHKLAIALIDLERFKNINDSLGRTTGDILLKQVAEWLTHKVGDANLLARIDADHFAVVLPEVRQDGNLAGLVEKTMEAFYQHPFHLNDTVFRISIRAGIALFPDDGGDAETLFRNAEAALKRAKTNGHRYLFYTQKMTAAVAGKLTLENQLRQAIDNEEFVLYYQPKVNLLSGKVTSAEALIRWNDPRSGLVPPGMFIPILEETGLIYEVGRWALRKAIEDYQRWRALGLPAVRIAVNVSPLQLRSHDFVAEIGRKISTDPRAAEGLELEITESLVMEDVKRSITSLQAIRAMGITIAIDDFGTGFSSLNYLARLPIDTLKIDRSFVIEMDAPEGLALVSTIIMVAHALKLKVVAEGVETEKQSRQLISLGCDEMQGFLFSKPVPAEIFETRFLAQSPTG